MNVRLLAVLAVGIITDLSMGQIRPSHPVPGQIAPDVHADALLQAPDWMHPGEIDLDAFKGKVVYLKFWSTGCLPCIQAMPKHNELKKKYGDKLVFIGVTPQTLDDIAGFMDSHETSMIVLSDPENTTWWRYYPPGQGSGTLICPDGRVSRVSVSDLELDEGMIEMAMRNEYEPGPPIDMSGEILPQARALGVEWGKPRGEQDLLIGQDPYSIAEKASFQLICRPSHENGKFQGITQGDKGTWLCAPALWIINSCVKLHGFDVMGMHTPKNRIIGPDWLGERYFDFIYNLPGVETAAQQEMIQSALSNGMGLEFSRETRTMEGYRLVWVDESKKPGVSTDEYHRWLGTQEDIGDGRRGVQITNHSLMRLGRQLERILGVPFVSDDDSAGYDFMIPSVREYSIDEIGLYMLDHYGVKFVKDDVEVEVLVVREKKEMGG